MSTFFKMPEKMVRNLQCVITSNNLITYFTFCHICYSTSLHTPNPLPLTLNENKNFPTRCSWDGVEMCTKN